MGTEAEEIREDMTHVCWDFGKEKELFFKKKQGCEKTLPNSIISLGLTNLFLMWEGILSPKIKKYKQTVTG